MSTAVSIRALIITVPKYPEGSSLGPIQGAARHAADFKRWLLEVKRAKSDNVIVLDTVKTTTKESIKKALRAIVNAGAGKTSEFYFYFSGHGVVRYDDGPQADTLLLLTSEFNAPEDDGDKTIPFEELRGRLIRALGPGQHFYFVDACRNILPPGLLTQGSLGMQFAMKGLANCYHTLYSATLGGKAANDDKFAAALLAGLYGRGRAKEPDGELYAVTFHSLFGYVRALAGGEPDSRGACDGKLVTGLPWPRLQIYVTGDADLVPFEVTLVGRHQARFSAEFIGSVHSMEIPAGDYGITMTTPMGQVEIGETRLQVWDDLALEVALQREGESNYLFPFPFSFDADSDADRPESFVRTVGLRRPEPTKLLLRGPSGGRVEVLGRDGKAQEIALDRRGRGAFALSSGDYRVCLYDLDRSILTAKDVTLTAGTRLPVELVPDRGAPVHASILRALGQHRNAGTVRFAQGLDALASRDLGLWLGALGAASIVAPEDRYGRAATRVLRETWTQTPDSGSAYVLGCSLDPEVTLAVRVGSHGRWQPAHPVEGLVGVRALRIDRDSGPLLLSLRRSRIPVAVVSHVLSGHVTLVTITDDANSATGVEIHQFFLTPAKARGPADRAAAALRVGRVQQMWRVQRDFAALHPLYSEETGLDPFLSHCLDIETFEPMTAILAVYELWRRGVAPAHSPLREAIERLRRMCSSLPDVAVFCRLLGEAGGVPDPPLIAEAFMLADLPPELRALPEHRPVLEQLWTGWLGSTREDPP